MSTPTSYQCPCGAKHKVPMYAVAQNASGHSVNHTCKCGRVNKLTPHGHVLFGTPKKGAQS